MGANILARRLESLSIQRIAWTLMRCRRSWRPRTGFGTVVQYFCLPPAATLDVVTLAGGGRRGPSSPQYPSDSIQVDSSPVFARGGARRTFGAIQESHLLGEHELRPATIRDKLNGRQ